MPFVFAIAQGILPDVVTSGKGRRWSCLLSMSSSFSARRRRERAPGVATEPGPRLCDGRV